jgi:mannan endo-1,4-beta-mannosidase
MVFGRLAKKLLGGLGAGTTTTAAAAAQPPTATTTTTTQHQPDQQQQQYAGVNCYYLLTRAADPGCRPMVEATLDSLASIQGLTVVRCWAFCDGAEKWNALQPQPGQLDERVFQALDWLLDAANKRGLKLQLTLTNFWKDFGGMPQYVAWARAERQGGKGNAPPPPLEERGDAFFDDERAQEMFRAFVERVVTRVSTVTGRPYRDDPAIHAWDLVNEARCEPNGGGGGGGGGGDNASSSSSSSKRLAQWLHETAALVKSLDPNHRVTAGLEGFFGPSTPDLAQRANPYSSAIQHGADFVAAFSSPHLDFCCIHLYPNQWLSNGAFQNDSQRIAWAARWVEAHAEACALYLSNKPLCVQEFGWKASAAAGGGGGPQRRAELFSAVLGACAKHPGVIEGALAWMFADPSYPDYDGYTLYPGDGGPTAEAERQSCGGGGRVERDCVASLGALAAFGGGGGGRPAPA